MNSGLQAIGAQATLCKCCGAPAFFYGVVDFHFHKNCEICPQPGGDSALLAEIALYWLGAREETCMSLFSLSTRAF